MVCAGADKPLVALALLRALGAERVIVFTSSVESTQRCRPWHMQIKADGHAGRNVLWRCCARWAQSASSFPHPPSSSRSGAAHGAHKIFKTFIVLRALGAERVITSQSPVESTSWCPP